MAIIITTLLILLCAPVLSAREYPRIERLTTEQGLSQSMVYGTFQDREGFLWFATRDGLSRYDGYGFMVFRYDPFDSTSLPWPNVLHITEDAAGNIWLSSIAEICRLDRRTYRFTKVDCGTGAADVRALLGDRRGNMWVGTGRGLTRYDTRTGAVLRCRTDPGNPARLFGDSITSLYEDRAGTLWVGTNGRYLHRWNPDNGSFTRFDSGQPDIANITCIGEDRRGTIYTFALSIESKSVLLGFDRSNGAVVAVIDRPGERFYPRAYNVQPMCIDSSDGVWIQIMSWIRRNHRVDRTILMRIPLHGDSDGLVFQTPGEHPVAMQVLQMLCDRSGIVWAGTDSGVVKMSLEKPLFTTVNNIPGDATSLSNNHVRGIFEDRRGALWVGTDDGLNCLQPGSRHWVRYMLEGDPRVPISRRANTLFEEIDGTLLIGTNLAFSVYDRAADAFVDGMQRGNRPVQVWSLCRDAAGLLWVGTRVDGIFVYDRNRRPVCRFTPRAGDSTTIGPGLVWDMHCDRRGQLWIATSEGLYRWMPERRIFKRYGRSPADPHGLSGNNVCAILEDPAGVLWFTTYGGGLNRYDRDRDAFTSITTRDGLPSNALYGTLMDASGKLWISSNTGLACYDPSTGSCRVYTAGDGLQSNEFSFRAFCRMRSGALVFGGIHGFTMFNPDSLRECSRDVPVVVTEFRVFDRIVRRELREDDTITIDHDQNLISFQFAALDFANPAGIRYAYRLEGFDTSWIDCAARRYASFTNLDPGSYVFTVKAANSSGRWTQRPLRIVLRVIPRFWMTWWFRAAALAVILLAATGGALWRIRSIRRTEALRRRSVESELQALRLQVNPHFISNALGSIQHLVLVADRDQAVEYLDRFARLMRVVLENSERTSIPLADELANLRNYLELEMFRFEGRIRYTIEVDPALDIHAISIPTMLIQPCVENALRHGLLHRSGGGRLAITIEGRGDRICCSIEDDGVGRRRAAELRPSREGEGRSMGLRMTQERLEILNAVAPAQEPISMRVVDLADARGEPAGTRVDLFIPMEYA